MKKILFSIIIVLLVSFSFAQSKYKSPIAIEKAYYQAWIAGVRGGGSGINFTIFLKKELTKNTVIKKLYFRNKAVDPIKMSTLEYQFSFVGDANFERGYEPATDDSQLPKKIINPPLKINDNQALLEYIHFGKRRFFKIIKIEEKELLAYPSAQPQNQENN